jgi:GNAT superfamily N-acetyltransferase
MNPRSCVSGRRRSRWAASLIDAARSKQGDRETVKRVTQKEPFVLDEDVRVQMVRDDLQDIPLFALPDGYGIRWFQPGDEGHWMRIHQECAGYGDLKPTLFADQFGSDAAELGRRIVFVCRGDGYPISTNAAWMNDWRGQHWGRVHWVATCASEQGKGLSKPLMTAVCERLRDLGHERAYLTTNTARVRAISLYRAFGFKPFSESEEEERAWEELLEKMGEARGVPEGKKGVPSTFAKASADRGSK